MHVAVKRADAGRPLHHRTAAGCKQISDAISIRYNVHAEFGATAVSDRTLAAGLDGAPRTTSLKYTQCPTTTLMLSHQGSLVDLTSLMLQVTMDIARTFVASLTTFGTMGIYSYLFLYWHTWVMQSDTDAGSSDVDGPTISQSQYRIASLLVTWILLAAAAFVHSRAVLVSRKAIHVLAASHTENRRRAHTNVGANTEHPVEQ